LLSAGLYDVTVTFDRLPEGLEAEIRSYGPLRFRISHNTVVVTIKEEESRVLDVVGALARRGRVLRLEVNGASLEDIFMEITGKTK